MTAECSVVANCIVCLARTAQCVVYAPLDVAALTAKTGKLSTITSIRDICTMQS